MTTPETTTRTNELKITRRNMLKSMAAASTAAVVFPTPLSASDGVPVTETSSLAQLIENHRRAWQTFEDHCCEASAIESAYKAKHPRPLVPTTLTHGGKAPERYELNVDHPHDAQERIRRSHSELRKQYCSNLAKEMAPAHWQAMADAIDRSELQCMAALEQAIDEEEARRAAFGLNEAKRDWEHMSHAEDTAIVEVMRYAPVTTIEAEEKASYLMEWYSREYGFEDHHFEALVQGHRPRN